MKTRILLLLLCLPSLLHAQQISGKIIDGSGQPVSSATILLQAADSTVIEAVVTDGRGQFLFKKKTSPYCLQIRHLAYKARTVHGTDLSGPIVLEESIQSLDGVVVKAAQPQFDIKENGALSYHGKDLIKNRPVTNALNLLDEIPILQKTGSDYEIVGTTASTIIINGRKSQMTSGQIRQYLSSLPPEKVKNIEIFYTTPPQYGVRGASINLVMDHGKSENLQVGGTLYAVASQGYYSNWGGGGNLSLSHKRWSLDMGYTAGATKKHADLTLNSSHLVADSRSDILLHTIDMNKNISHRVFANFSYEWKNKDRLNIIYSGSLSSPEGETHGDLSMRNTRTDHRMEKDGDNQLHSVNADWQHGQWRAGTGFVFYKQNSDQCMASRTQEEETRLVTESGQTVRRWTPYVNHSVKAGKGSLSYGLNSLFSLVNNVYSVLHNEIDSYDQSFDLKQNELAISAFVGWGQKIGKKGSLNLSLEGEYFKSDIKKGDEAQTLWEDFHLYPNFTLMYKLKAKTALQVTLNSRKHYPSYWQTTPGRSYMNLYLTNDGNPLLKPYMTYQMNVNYILNSKYIIGLFANIAPDYSTQILYQHPEQLWASYKFYNLDYSNKWGLMGVVPVKWSKSADTKLTVNAILMSQKGSYEDIAFSRHNVTGRINMTNNFILDKKRTFAIQVSGWYQLPVIQTIYDVEDMFYTSAAFVWQPKKTGWRFTVKAEDLFDTYVMKTKVHYVNQNYGFCNEVDNRVLSLNVRYTFKKYNSKKQKEVDTSRLGI